MSKSKVVGNSDPLYKIFSSIRRNKKKIMRYYFDESGSITTHQSPFNRFFIIAGCTSNNPKKVKRVFRKAKVKYLKNHPDLELDIKQEIKGAQMPLKFKEYIFDELIKKTDISFNFIVFDNYNAMEHLRAKPSITFNYLMFLQVEKLITEYNHLHLDLDDRNTAIENLKALEEYLKTKLCVESNKVSDVTVEFFDSANHTMIQISDVLANHLHRLFKQVAFGKDETENSNLLYKLHIDNMQTCQYFPTSKCHCLHLFSPQI